MATVYPKAALFNAINEIAKKGKPISFMFGSPLTMPDYSGGVGVPGVDDIIKLIEERIIDPGVYSQYSSYVAGLSGSNKYQKAFEFISGWYEQDFSNSIIEHAIISGCQQGGLDTLFYPDSLNELASFVKNEKILVNSILTTNFDPLIETCFRSVGVKFASYTLTADGAIPQTVMRDSSVIDIFHLHGFWKDSDTLHTAGQLTQLRPHLTSSLKDIIKESSVIVIAYGGWDDVFVRAITETLYDQKTKSDILWCFYEKDSSIINDNYKKLLSAASPALIGNRFRCYGNINCKSFFKEMNETFNIRSDFPVLIDKNVISKANNSIIKNLIRKDNRVTSDYLDNNVVLKKSFIEYKEHHNSIRMNERYTAITNLVSKRIISITTMLGGDKNGFLSSVVYNNEVFNKLPVYRVDVTGIDSIDEFYAEFKKQIGLHLAPFISIHSQDDGCILILDNLSDLELINWKVSINEAINGITNGSKKIFTILLGDNTLEGLSFPYVKLVALDNPDLYEYVRAHPDAREEFLERSNYHKIIELTNFLPEKIDGLFHDLRIMSLEDYIESKEDDELVSGNVFGYFSNEILPKEFQDYIYEFSVSENKENKDCYAILKILTVLEYGETFKNIRRYYSGNKFSQNSFHRLINLGLLNIRPRLISLRNEHRPQGSIVITLNPLVSSYMKNKISEVDVFEITKEGLELSLGINWMSGAIKLNGSVKEQISESHSYGPGNIHALICVFMRFSIREQLEREFRSVFYASLVYLNYLYSKGRFSDVVSSATEIYSICRDFGEIVAPYKLLINKSEGLRMIGMHEEAELILNTLLAKNDKLTNDELINVNVELAYLYGHADNEKGVVNCFRKVKKLTHNKSWQWITIEGIVAQFLPVETRLTKLNQLEHKARSLGLSSAANNIALNIASEVKDVEQRNSIFDKVIHSSSDGYTQIRAILKKAKSFISSGRVDKISSKDRVVLKDAYVYLFTQRLGKMTESCHDILWDIYSDENNMNSLLNLYRHSAINWLLNGETTRDAKFLNDLYSKREDFILSDCYVLFVELVEMKVSLSAVVPVNDSVDDCV